MIQELRRRVGRLRSRRGPNLFAVYLRIALGFAFVPAGLKKLLVQRFSDPSNTGPFHEFLHAFYQTGLFYPFVGAVQLVAACLLMTQRFAWLGALLVFPILTAILVLCWSTGVYPTATVVTLMWLGTLGLLVWELERWVPCFDEATRGQDRPPRPVDLRLWGRCGVVMLGLYLAACAAYGGVYRPRGLELGDPAFYVFPGLLLVPALTLWIERRQRR